jgi:UPF0716 protein FxsA
MIRWLLLFLVGIAFLEVIVLIAVGKLIGIVPTVFLLFGSAILGTYLARREGIRTYLSAIRQMQEGFLPGDAIVEGFCVLLGGILLFLPGFLTDLIGLFFLIPYTRTRIKNYIIAWLRRKWEQGEWIWIRRF